MCLASAWVVDQGLSAKQSLRAYRAFVRTRDGRLISVYRPQPRWAERGYLPRTWHRTSDNPHMRDDYGFHAFKDLCTARRWCRTVTGGHRREVWEVQVAGEVAEHVTGYRATKMKLVRRMYRRVGVQA